MSCKRSTLCALLLPLGRSSLEGVQIWANNPDVRVCYSGRTTFAGAPEVCDGALLGSAQTGRNAPSFVNLRVRLASNPRGQSLMYRTMVRRSASSPPEWTPFAYDNQWLSNQYLFPMEQLTVYMYRP